MRCVLTRDGHGSAGPAGAQARLDAAVPWRQPASAKQTVLLQHLGVAVPPGVSKGEAADLLSVVLEDWD